MRATRLTHIAILVLVSCAASAQYKMPAGSFSNGGATMTGGSYVVRGIAGQSVVGNEDLSAAGAYKMKPGLNAVITTTDPLLPDLVFTISAVGPATVAPGENITVSFTLKNIGFATVESDINVKAYLSTNPEFEPGIDIPIEPMLTVTNTLDVNSTISFPGVSQSGELVIPSSTAKATYQVLLVIDPLQAIVEKSEFNNVVSEELTVADDPTVVKDEQGPVFGTISLPDLISDQASISVAVTDAISGVSHVEFYHRPAISNDAFESEPITGTTYSIGLQTSWADEIGIKGYFIAYDKKDNSTKSTEFYVYNGVPSAQILPGLDFGGQLEDYRIVSIPYDLSEKSLDEVFKSMGSYDKTQWRAVRYQGGRNVDNKEGFTKVERGQAFWFNSVEKPDISVGAGTTVGKDQSPDFSLALEKGYNQVGDPFTFDISWGDVLAANESISSKLSQQVLVYNSTNISLDPSDILKAWSGGFVAAEEAMTISIPASLKNGSGRISGSVIENNNPDLEAWMISVGVQQEGVINTLGGIGMHPQASVSKDIYDITTPPKFVKYVSLSTEHKDFFQPMFSRDIVKTMQSYNWSFMLESNINSSLAEITWNNDGLQSSMAELLLYDAEQRAMIDMKRSDRYSFDPQRSRNFRFFFGSDRMQVKPDIQEIGVAWPNPSSDVVHIPYLVKDRSHVQIEVYDLMGRRVSSVADRVHDAGYHTATWNRTAFDGSVVSPGMYLYRMNGSATIGRIIVN